MLCKHQVSLCQLHNCTACNYQGNEQDCPFAYNESAEVSNPTFAQMLQIYDKSRNSYQHRKSVVQSVISDLSRVGLTLESKANEMTRAKFKMLISLLQSPMADGSIRRGNTILSHLAAFKSITSEWLEDKYEEMGLDMPTFSIPRFKAERVKVQEVSDRTVRKVEIEMEKWLASGSKSDKEAYKMCFFDLYCGMRAGDICAAKWDIIKHTTMGVMIAYVPHKTLHSTGVMVSFPIPNHIYVKIEPLIGNPDDYIITRHTNRTPVSIRKHGEYEGMHVYLRNKVNKMLSLCGIGNEFKKQKKLHALRKYFATDNMFMIGKEETAKRCGNTVNVLNRNYLGSLLRKVM